MALPSSVLLKMDRAQEHLDRLDDEIRPWRTSKPYRLVRERHEVPVTEFRAKVRINPPIPKPVPLLIGDAVHNMRSALDHLANALVIQNGKIPNTSTEFPLFADRPPSKSEKARFMSKIDKMSPAARRQIIRLQPYHRGNDAHFESLWILHRLDIIDKHRELSIIGGRYSLPDTFRPQEVNEAMLVQGGRIYIPFNDGDEIRILGVDKDFEPDVTGWIQVRWENGSRYTADLDKLRLMHANVRDDVLPRFTRFFP